METLTDNELLLICEPLVSKLVRKELISKGVNPYYLETFCTQIKSHSYLYLERNSLECNVHVYKSLFTKEDHLYKNIFFSRVKGIPLSEAVYKFLCLINVN